MHPESIREIVASAQSKPNTSALIMGTSPSHTRRAIWPDIKAALAYASYGATGAELRRITLPNNSQILIVSQDLIDRLRGHHFDVILVDDAVDDKDTLAILRTLVRPPA